MELLDPDVVMFGPGTDSPLVPIVVERAPGIVVFTHDRLAAVVRLDETDGRIGHLKSFVVPPTRTPRRKDDGPER
jgi:hypothetical protein